MKYAYNPNHPIQLSDNQLVNLPTARDSGKQMLLTAAQVGADMQLERCREWLKKEEFLPRIIADFMNAMRPSPLSKREQALQAIDAVLADENRIFLPEVLNALEVSREALMMGENG